MTRTQFEPTWSHGPISGPLNGFLGAVMLAGLARVVHLPLWLPAALSAIGVTAAVLVGQRRKTAGVNVAFRVACWAGAGLWATWTIWRGWSLVGIVVLLLGATLAGLLAPAFAQSTEPAGGPQAATTAGRGMESEWAVLIQRVCGIREPVTVRKAKDWPHRTGYTLDVEFAAGAPHTWEVLRDGQVGLAAARRLPPGCPVNAERSTKHQGAAVLHVSTVNDMERDIDFPADYSPRSILDEFPIGLYLDKRPTLVELYQSAGIVAGQRGGGKTVILQDMNGQLHRCVDVVIWHVDLNGGGMSSAWLTPYAVGEIDTPTVDWVACSPAEAIQMARVGNAIAKDRKRRYQRLMIERNTDILPVSRDLPAIVIIVDEGGEVTGEDASRDAQQAAAELRELQRIGRAMCVNVVFSVQRATADYVPSQMKKAAALSIITRVKDQAEIAHLLEWKKGLSSDDLMYPGCAYIKRNNDVVLMFKAFRLLPYQIAEIARATWRLRPTLDQAAQVVGGKVYAQRWDRPEVREFLAGLAGEDVAAAAVSDEPAERRPAASSAVRGAAAQVARAGDLLRMTRERAPEPKPEPAPPTVAPSGVLSMPADRIRAEVEAIAALAAVDPREAPVLAPEAARELGTPAERRAFMVGLIDTAGPDGMATGDIVKAVWSAGITVRRQTVSEWLAEEQQAGAVLSPRYGQWITPRHAAT